MSASGKCEAGDKSPQALIHLLMTGGGKWLPSNIDFGMSSLRLILIAARAIFIVMARQPEGIHLTYKYFDGFSPQD